MSLEEQAEALAQSKLEALIEENRKLKALCRYQYLTLGYYGTPFNYNEKNNVRHPITNEVASGIMHEGGHDARYAHKIAILQLKFTAEEICSWGSVWESLEQAQAFSKQHWSDDEKIDDLPVLNGQPERMHESEGRRANP